MYARKVSWEGERANEVMVAIEYGGRSKIDNDDILEPSQAGGVLRREFCPCFYAD